MKEACTVSATLRARVESIGAPKVPGEVTTQSFTDAYAVMNTARGEARGGGVQV